MFAELEWCADHGFKVMLADANFGIFERDVDISQKIADLKAVHGYPKFVGNNYAKNTVKHLSKIIEIFTEAGIVAEGKMSMQSLRRRHAGDHPPQEHQGGALQRPVRRVPTQRAARCPST